MKLDLPVFAPELNTFDDKEFLEWWEGCLAQTPCVVLLEDIDTVYNKRENITPGAVSFGCLLNCISGAEGADGIFLIVTTNKIECVDEALGVPVAGRSSRPGRIDRVIEMGALSDACRLKIAERILSDCPSRIRELVESGEGMTGCQFQDLCAQEALLYHWREE